MVSGDAPRARGAIDGAAPTRHGHRKTLFVNLLKHNAPAGALGTIAFDRIDFKGPVDGRVAAEAHLVGVA